MGRRNWTLARIALLTIGSATATASAQSPFAEALRATIPINRGSSAALAIADVDGDGRDDAFLGNRLGQDQLWRNADGIRLESTTWLPADSDTTTDARFVDVDGDGDPDLVCGIIDAASPFFERLRLYVNDGTGTFTDRSAANLPTSTGGRFAAGDVDGDGDADLVVAYANSRTNAVLLNDGTGRFTPASVGLPNVAPFPTDIELFDADGDSDLDVLVVSGCPCLLLNDGTGTFVDNTSAAIPPGIFAMFVDTGDLDGDGDTDLALAPLTLLENDGTGTFTDVTGPRIPAGLSGRPCVVDVDGDLDLDLVCSQAPSMIPASVGQNLLLSNDGSGSFTNSTPIAMPTDNDQTLAVAAIDADVDGDLDLLIGNNASPDRLYANDGTGMFVDVGAPSAPPPGNTVSGIAFGDVDGDSDIDGLAIASGSPGARNHLWSNDGFARFEDVTATQMPTIRDNSRDIATGDIDGDGDIDAVVANTLVNRALVNDGNGTFQSVLMLASPNLPALSFAVKLADVEPDGDLDAVFAAIGTAGAQNKLFINDGAGNFTDESATRFPATQFGAFDVVVGDVSGDGLPDVLFAAFAGATGIQQYRNTGTGTFVDVTTQTMPGSGPAIRLALADVDADGDLDLLTSSSAGARVLTNDGTGGFSDATATALTTRPSGIRIAVADFDLDGDVDAVFDDKILWNDGSGAFVTAVEPVGRDLLEQLGALSAFDLDQDGDSDLVYGYGFGVPPRIYWNLATQTRLPFATEIGHDLEVEVYARNGVPRTSDSALPLVSAPAAAPLPIAPFGTLLVDPRLAIPLSAITLDPTTRFGVAREPVPVDPALRGLEFAIQTVLAQQPTRVVLTNAVRDRVLR